MRYERVCKLFIPLRMSISWGWHFPCFSKISTCTQMSLLQVPVRHSKPKPTDKWVYARQKISSLPKPIWCDYKQTDLRAKRRFLLGAEFDDWKRKDLKEFKDDAMKAYESSDSIQFVDVALRLVKYLNTLNRSGTAIVGRKGTGKSHIMQTACLISSQMRPDIFTIPKILAGMSSTRF
jgi:hypothetical protein